MRNMHVAMSYERRINLSTKIVKSKKTYARSKSKASASRQTKDASLGAPRVCAL